MSNKLVATSPHRRVKEKDLVHGQRIVKANVGKYLGPGFDPRVSILERVIVLDDEEPVFEGFVYFTMEGGSRTFIPVEKMINGEESPGGSITYWIAQGC